MVKTPTSATVQVSDQGRLVIPAHLRRALNIKPGEKLIARIEDDRLVIERREQIIARIRARFAEIPADVSLADELIAERREAARREALE